jgi:hypothetical protein
MGTQKSEINSEAFLKVLAQQFQISPDSLQRLLKEVSETDQRFQELPVQKMILEVSRRYSELLYQQIEQELGLKTLDPLNQQDTSDTSISIVNLLDSQESKSLDVQIVAIQADQPTSERFWDKTDRIVVMTIGGASIGGAIGLIPGAIAGATVAALYGWYIGFAKTKSEQTN